MCSKFTELANGDAKASVSKTSIGKRCVFAHAITRDGLLTSKTDNVEFLQPPFDELDNLTIKLRTSEFIFECKNDNINDYHDQMDNKKFIDWFQNRVIETFNDTYGNAKKAVFFMDQCPFHMTSDGLPSINDTKETIVSYYDKHGITSISVIRFNKNGIKSNILTFNRSSFLKNPKMKNPTSGGPCKDELYIYLYLYLKKKNPVSLEPIVRKIAKQFGHDVLFACPYNPDDMPAEFLNAYVKLMVKQCAKKHRTIQELKFDIRKGFYGGKTRCSRSHNAVNSHVASGWFAKCEQHMIFEIEKILKIKEKSIDNLWSAGSNIKLEDAFFRIPRRSKTLNKLAEKFCVVIDDYEVQFV